MAGPKTKTTADIYQVYLIYGPEDYLIEQEVQKLLDRILSPKERGLNLHIFEGDQHSAQEIIRTAQTVPMFSRYRFVLVNAADHLEEKQVETLMEYIRKPSPTTCLVLRAQFLGPWKSFRAEMDKAGRVIEHGRLRRRELVSWIRKRMAEKGKSTTEEAANYLIELLGDHLQSMESAVEKVSLATGAKKAVELSDVLETISGIKVNTISDLTDAIGHKNLEKALSILEKAMNSKLIPFKKDQETSRISDPAPLLLSMMAKHYRQIWVAKEMSSRRHGLTEIAGRLKIGAWNAEKLLEQARHFSLSSLRHGIMRCHHTDLAIKRGRGPQDLLMEKLVIDLCRPL